MRFSLFFTNTGHTLSDEEFSEVLTMYFDWLLDRDFVDAMVPFAQFEQWFTQLSWRIVRSKSHFSDFDIDRVEDTMFKTSEELDALSPTINRGSVDFSMTNCLVQ